MRADRTSLLVGVVALVAGGLTLLDHLAGVRVDAVVVAAAAGIAVSVTSLLREGVLLVRRRRRAAPRPLASGNGCAGSAGRP